MKVLLLAIFFLLTTYSHATLRKISLPEDEVNTNTTATKAPVIHNIRPTELLDLPIELVEGILKELPPRCLLSVSPIVSRFFRGLTRSRFVSPPHVYFERLFELEFPGLSPEDYCGKERVAKSSGIITCWRGDLFVGNYQNLKVTEFEGFYKRFKILLAIEPITTKPEDDLVQQWFSVFWKTRIHLTQMQNIGPQWQTPFSNQILAFIGEIFKRHNPFPEITN